MKKIGYMPLNGGIMGQATGHQKDQLQLVHNRSFWFPANWATGNWTDHNWLQLATAVQLWSVAVQSSCQSLYQLPTGLWNTTFPSERKKWETNSEPQLEVMWKGTPCLEKTWRRKSFANSGDVTLSLVGMNMHCFDSWSTTTRIAVYLEELGSCSMKSIEMEFLLTPEMSPCRRLGWICTVLIVDPQLRGLQCIRRNWGVAQWNP